MQSKSLLPQAQAYHGKAHLSPESKAARQQRLTDRGASNASVPSQRRNFSSFLTRSSTGDTDPESQELLEDDDAWQESPAGISVSVGQLYLLSTAFLWGTYSPTLKYLFSLPGPPDPSALTAARCTIQAASLLAVDTWMSRSPANRQDSQGKQRVQSGVVWKAGAEMGLWNFLATSCQAVGLSHTTAIRAAFIIQATSLLTPLLAALTGEALSRNVWIGCFLALCSTALITLDGAKPALEASTQLINVGDVAVLGAAFFYSAATVRLGSYAKSIPAVSLASAKSTALAAWAFVWLGSSAVGAVRAGQPVGSLWEGYKEPAAWALITWSAIGPGALAAVLSTWGQSSVPASQAQVYYSSVPIWSTLLAIMFLKDEVLGPLGWLGGAGIVAAGLIAARP